MKKKLLVLMVTIVALFGLVACSGGSEQPKQDEATTPNPNAVVNPAMLGEVQYSVGAWNTLASLDNKVVYDTGKGIIAFTFGDRDVADQELASLAIEGTPVATAPIELVDESEEVEINDISGHRQAIKIGEINGEVFIYQTDTHKYCLVAVYDNPENIAEAHQMVDEVFTSMRVEGDAISKVPEEETAPPAEEA